METGELQGSQTERLEGLIQQARSGKSVQLSIRVYTSMVKQVVQSESTDDIQDASDMNLLVGEFTPKRPEGATAEKISKVYAVCPLNEIDVNDKITRHIANERLKMDYARLKAAGVKFEEKFF